MDRIAVSGDLEGSRIAPARAALLKTVRRVLGRLGQRFGPALLAPPVLTRGLDEFSAAFRTAEPLFAFMAELNEATWPARYRLGVGVGRIDLGERSGDAAKMDGPAFHRAAAALAEARAGSLALSINAPDFDGVDLRAVEALALAHAVIVSGWTASTLRVVREVRGGASQRDAAARLRITPQAVSKALRRGRYTELLRIEEAAHGVLTRRMRLKGR